MRSEEIRFYNTLYSGEAILCFYRLRGMQINLQQLKGEEGVDQN